MNYKLLNQENFQSLKESEGLTARELTLEFRRDEIIYIFKDSDNSFCCAIRIKNSNSKLPLINGIGITYENLAQKGGEMSQFLQLKCFYEIYLHYFSELIKEILENYDTGKGAMSASVSKIIDKWKYFFSIPKLEILAKEQIIGLIGELIFLQKLMKIFRDASIQFWTPERGEEDFVFPNKIIEVKTTDKDRHEHIINGIGQLKTIPGQTKYIHSIIIASSDAEDSVTLPDLVSEISAALSSHPENNDLFLHKIRHRGYDPRDAENYSPFRYNVIKSAFFTVDEPFPKLTTDELCKPLNSRVSKIRYTIDIEGVASIDFNEIGLEPSITS